MIATVKTIEHPHVVVEQAFSASGLGRLPYPGGAVRIPPPVITGIVLALVGAAIGLIVVVDRAEASVEARVRRYALAITNADAEAALAELSPRQRATYAGFVDQQLGNIYEVRGIAVRSPSLLDRALHRLPAGPTEVTVILDVNRAYPEDYYMPTTRVPLERVDGAWYLARPLLAKE